MTRWAAIVLAAGRSKRFGAADKLAAELNGKTVLDHVLDSLASAGLDQVILVTGPEAAAVPEAVDHVVNATPEAGMGVSLATGMTALQSCDGVFIVLGDVPFVRAGLVVAMKERLSDHDIVVPMHDGQRGHPVLFGPACFDALRQCRGDVGARHVITSGLFRVAMYEDESAAGQMDVDTPEDLARLRGVAVRKGSSAD